MKRKFILFDLDGTLVDTRHFIVHALNDLSHTFGFEHVSAYDEQALRNVRSSEFLRALGIPFWEAPFLIGIIKRRLEHAISSMQFVKGIPETLLTLKQHGYLLGVLTSNNKKNMNVFLKKYHGNYFDITKSNVGIFQKDKAIRVLAQKEGFDMHDVVYIGDETRDIKAAKAAGAHIIAVTWGFNSEYILETMHPERIANTPEDILTIIKKL